MKKQWCEGCREMEWSAYRRPDAGGRVLCNRRYYEFLRRKSPTGLVPRPTWAMRGEKAK